MKPLTIFLAVCCSQIFYPLCMAETLHSPDGKVAVNVFANPAGQLSYEVRWKERLVVEPSKLGITVQGVDLGEKSTIGDAALMKRNQTYTTRGVHTLGRDHHVEATFPIQHSPSGKQWKLVCRAYDDGVAFRYIIPGEGVQHVDGESSSWKVMANSRAWFFERLAKKWKLKSYAGEWLETDVSQLDTVSPPGPIQGTPIVFQLPNEIGYAAITKAATYNYSGMRLKATGERMLVADFTEGRKGFDVEGTITTPWRVTILADDLNELVNTDLIKNLNPAPDAELFADTSYIKPGRTAWSWETLSLGTPETQRTFIDLAAKMEFEYSTIDDGWKDWDAPWETVEQLCDHAETKNVGVWLWVHSKDILDPTDDYQQMRNYFERVAATGAVGLKIDFMNGESKELVDFEIAVLRNAAMRKLMINFHGCHASTGEERTYPNEMTREGIRGIEVNKMKEGPLPASHNAALPFTRFVVGHADYTPVLFSNPGPTTWAHQVATLVTYTSALQTYAEHPDTMMDMPVLKDVFPVLQSIPSNWDQTRVLPGSAIGELTAMARQRGDQWFVGILNGRQEVRDYVLDLSFLLSGAYQADLIQDDIEAQKVNLEGINAKADLHQYTTTLPCKVAQATISGGQKLSVRLAPGGGFVMRIRAPSAPVSPKR